MATAMGRSRSTRQGRPAVAETEPDRGVHQRHGQYGRAEGPEQELHEVPTSMNRRRGNCNPSPDYRLQAKNEPCPRCSFPGQRVSVKRPLFIAPPHDCIEDIIPDMLPEYVPVIV